MNTNLAKWLGRLVVAGMAFGSGAPAAAAADQPSSWPRKSVTIVVPFSPGGSTDQIARLFSAKLAEKLGQPFVVVNRPGAGTIVGMQEVVRARPDGYTLLLAVSTVSTQPALYPNLPYDIKRDLVPVSLLGKIPLLIYTNPAFPAHTLGELVEQARKPGADITYASPGAASTAGLTGELFNEKVKTEIRHIPYNSGSPAMTDVMGGNVDLLWGTAAQGLEQYRAKRLNAVAISSERRSPSFPEVPTFREQGVDLVAEEWFGLMAPKGTPPEIVARVSQAASEIVKGNSFGDDYNYFEFIGSDPASFGAYMDAQAALWTGLVHRLGLQVK
ncbi:tripartite tricarboxylate transporter substrate binding protein [Bordetella bronchiseptica]|uniref:tripartite tricarboxylate transporter substrate binding protein n=2 Tax=Bordetella bronchiseptica TaxID=518 RepID=UPI00046199C3|nr:tripartite tricarboxylate transporter substrate binding protein [Bordetella bronchiseptica]AWP78253.1 hypothetical protein B7P04_02780 [Bordetella bronchiseptica]KDB69442.1 tripartite tricarboxylate transporter family receptor [Bordetella bronchiseptica A1-7]KDC38081.1 tripartite tricarboxylate transporter family receptor [Bordetella bronchiseptica M435/02/3]KDC46863.1 tripartite tricarboxylate transporter family receptor [Bordetella bronchiseptica M85/00/2]KDC75149.1 tripartite tricarboxyl